MINLASEKLITIITLLTFVIIQNSVSNHEKPHTARPDQPPLLANLTTDDKWIQKSLERHNYYRTLHKVQPLQLNKTLCQMSQSWANYLLSKGLESNNQGGEVSFFDHNYAVMDEQNVGENLYYLSAYIHQLTPSLAVNFWYNEHKDYDYTLATAKANSTNDTFVGHFTQLMWNSSKQFGTAYASEKLSNNQTLTFVTAYYYPRGNMYSDDALSSPISLFLENVPPPANISSPEKTIEEIVQKLGLSMGSVTTPGGWIAAAGAKHNDFRMEFSVPEILISDVLCQTSQSWADQLLKMGLEDFNKNQMLLYIKNAKLGGDKSILGENMMYFISNTDDMDSSIPVSLWFDENKFYDFSKRKTDFNKSKTAKTHHFEQIIWKSTTHMCMTYSSGMAENGQYLAFFVAHYYPSGQGKKEEEKITNISIQSIAHFLKQMF